MGPAVGLQELASASLPSLGGDPLQPSWSRSLSELAAASRSLVNNAGPTPPQPTAAAQALLGSTRTDFGSVAARTPTPSTAPSARFLSLAERSSRHRDSILERAVNRQRERSRQALEKSVQRQLEDDWTQERELWMKELVGNRNMVDASGTGGSLSLASSQSSPSYPLMSGPLTSDLLPGYTSTSNKTLDAAMAKDHAKLVQSLSSTDISTVVAQFQQLPSVEGHNAGYATAWQLFAYMIPSLDTPIGGALGALVHLCRQYQTFVKNRVAAGSLAQQDLSTPWSHATGMAATVAAYVKLDFGSDVSPWHVLYHCLRCGDAVAARDVLKAGTIAQDNPQEQRLIMSVIDVLANHQANLSCIWERGPALIPSQELNAMVDLFQRTTNLEPENTCKIGVLALISGNEPTSFNTVEDYLFGRMWAALQTQNPQQQLQGIGASIRKYGPDHFGGIEENEGWGYVLPLLATQQFKTALTFLAQVGGPSGLLQATHLALVMSMAGVALEDLGNSSRSSDLGSALLVKYAATLESVADLGIASSLVYLRRIPQAAVRQSEMASLVCRAPHLIDQLAGTIKEDASRNPGELDKYLDSAGVSTVLVTAAEKLTGNLEDKAKAEFALKLYMLAGHYAAVVSLLNRLITPTDVDNDNTQYWWKQSQDFYTYYLAKRTLVLTQLESSNNTDLVQVNRTLMEIRRFFATLRQEKFQDAFDIVKSLDLFPLFQEDLDSKVGVFKDLNPLLRQEIPVFLSGAVHCLHGMHRKIKSEARGVNESVEFHLRDLQMKARFLYIFAGLTSMPSNTKDDIMRLRNNMM